MAKHSVAFSAFLLMLFILTISEFSSVKGDLCEKPSKTWTGKCGNTRHCDDQCKAWEQAAHGACHVRDKKHMCFCYFNCPKAEKLSQDKLKAEELANNNKIEAEEVPSVEHRVPGSIDHP